MIFFCRTIFSQTSLELSVIENVVDVVKFIVQYGIWRINARTLDVKIPIPAIPHNIIGMEWTNFLVTVNDTNNNDSCYAVGKVKHVKG